MTRNFLFALVMGGMVAAGSAWAIPFGGDDTGNIPPDPITQKCEAKIGKTVQKYIKCLIDCHANRGKGKYLDLNAEDGCEDICKGKYDIAISKLTKAGPPVCPPPCSSPSSIRTVWKGFLDGNNNQVWCDGTTPFGGDDSGFVASTSDIAKCEAKFGAQANKLIGCFIKCHENRSKQKTDILGEEDCEDVCRATYNAKIPTFLGCAACSNTNAPTYADNLRTTTDNNNGLVYCAP